MSKVFAVIAIILGSAGTLLSVAVAFGASITPDQHTALLAVAGIFVTVLGLWFHPSVPVGEQQK